jgi:hypothetical protein
MERSLCSSIMQWWNLVDRSRNIYPCLWRLKSDVCRLHKLLRRYQSRGMQRRGWRQERSEGNGMKLLIELSIPVREAKMAILRDLLCHIPSPSDRVFG